MVKRKSNIVVGSSGLIKSINKKNVLNTIKRSEMISRAEISREVKLTMPLLLLLLVLMIVTIGPATMDM